jgi:hypothetical protein
MQNNLKEDIEQLRQIIRNLDLTWLDEELDEILSAGKLRTKEIKEGNKKLFNGIEQISFTDAEQLELIVTTLRNYFITLPKIQSETLNILKQNLKISKTVFKEIDSYEFKQIASNTERLERLLKEITN